MDVIARFRFFENAEVHPAETTIFNAGEKAEAMYVIMEGEVDIVVNDRCVYRAGPEDLIGEMALIDSSPRSATAVARSAARLVPVGKKQFLYMVKETPEFALHVLRVLVGRLRKMDRFDDDIPADYCRVSVSLPLSLTALDSRFLKSVRNCTRLFTCSLRKIR